MAVDPSYQRHGYGRQLLDALATRARRAGEAVLWADAREAAVPFYAACGAAISGSGSIDELTGLATRRVLFALAGSA
jgi:GNAT superfamily N-acetyltransferase